MYIVIFLLQFHLKSFTCTLSPSRIRVFTVRKPKNIVFSNLKSKIIYFNNSLYNTLNIKDSILAYNININNFYPHTPIKTIPQPQNNYKQSHPWPNTQTHNHKIAIPTAKTHFTNNQTHDKTPKPTTEFNDPWWQSTQPHHH